MNFEYGIKFTWLNFGNTGGPKRVNTVIDNTIINNTCGILVDDFSAANVFSNNRIADNVYGVSFSSFAQPSDNVFRNNVFSDNQYSIADGSRYANDIDTSNTVNGKPVYYWIDKHDLTVPADAGYVVLKNCSDITVQNLTLGNNGQGVLLCFSSNSKIIGNVFTNNVEGITLKDSSNNEISGNTIIGSRDYGVYLFRDTKDNTISENSIESTGKDGVHSDFSCNSNTISKNTIINCGEYGVYLSGSPNSMVIANNVSLCKLSGISLEYSDSNTIRQNYLTGNGLGLLVETAGNTITENTMIANTGWGIRLNGSQRNNVIHHNNFINNNVAEGLQVSMPAVWLFDPPGSQKDVPTLSPGNPNVWDDGKEGNYWSDYRRRYPNASEVGNTGVGNTPFFINENNIDYFPVDGAGNDTWVPFEPVTESSSKPEPIVSPPDNTTLPDQQNDNLAGTGLPMEYAFVITLAIAFIGVAAVITVILLRKKKLKTKT